MAQNPDLFSSVMGTSRGPAPFDPRGAVPIGRYSEHLSIKSEGDSYRHSPRTCSQILEALAHLDGSLPLYVLHPKNEDTLEDAERIVGGHTETIWNGDVHICPDIARGEPPLATLEDFRGMLAKQESDQGVWFMPPSTISGETLTSYRLFEGSQGQRYLALITVY